MTTKPSANRTGDLRWFKSSYSSNEEPACVEVALTWNKSSYSSNESADCVEVALTWNKSSYSTAEGPECVEVAATAATVHIRDSKNPDGPHLDITPEAWTAFLSYAARRA
jgi:hypothetical protein